MPLGGVLCGLAVLALLMYLPALSLPLIADDYIQISLSREYGHVGGWANLAADALYRCRATSLLLTHWTELLFGFSPLAFNASSIFLHVLNTFLVFFLGVWRPIGWKVSLFAAAFFAINERPHEAVMWYAALPELLVFTFVLLTFLLWILWLQGGSWLYYAGCLLCFLLALASKESAVCLVGFQIVTILVQRVQVTARVAQIIPFFILSVVYFAAIYSARSQHLHFNDGTFSLAAPFAHTMLIATGRLFWIWGAIAVIAVVCFRLWKLAFIAGAWIVIALLPYSFLTYMPRIPSRHHYLASVGVALLVAAAAAAWQSRGVVPRWAPALVAALILLHNCSYLWVWKQDKFLRRAAPTEDLIRFVENTEGPVYVNCFPYGEEVARLALRVRTRGKENQLIWRTQATGCVSDSAFSSSVLE